MAIFHDYLTPSHIALLRDEVREAQRAAGVVDRHGMPHGANHGANHGASLGGGGGGGSGGGGGGDGGGTGLRFVPIDNETFSLPPSLAHLRDRIPRSIRGYGMGYRHMCKG